MRIKRKHACGCRIKRARRQKTARLSFDYSTAANRAAVQNENGTCNPQVPFAQTY